MLNKLKCDEQWALIYFFCLLLIYMKTVGHFLLEVIQRWMNRIDTLWILNIIWPNFGKTSKIPWLPSSPKETFNPNDQNNKSDVTGCHHHIHILLVSGYFIFSSFLVRFRRGFRERVGLGPWATGKILVTGNTQGVAMETRNSGFHALFHQESRGKFSYLICLMHACHRYFVRCFIQSTPKVYSFLIMQSCQCQSQ